MGDHTSQKNTIGKGVSDVFDAILATIKGELVPNDVKVERVSKCNSCPELIKATRQCGLCLCLVDWKTQIPAQSCPVMQWGEWQNGSH